MEECQGSDDPGTGIAAVPRDIALAQYIDVGFNTVHVCKIPSPYCSLLRLQSIDNSTLPL
jgi:hypothetical protein